MFNHTTPTGKLRTGVSLKADIPYKHLYASVAMILS